MANYIVNELFSYTDLDLEAYGGVIEEGFEHVTRAPVLEAIRIATKIVSDPTAAQLVYGDVGKQFHGTINAADIMRVLTVVCERKLLLAVQDSENMGHAYVQCLAYPNITAKQLTMPLLHQIGNALSPGILQLSADYNPRTELVADCGTIVEDLAYGGRITTADRSSQPYKRPLRVTIRKFRKLPLGPGNYMIYELKHEHVKEKVAALRAYLAGDTNAPFPGLIIPQYSMQNMAESNAAETEETARERMVGWKRKRNTGHKEVGGAQVISDEELFQEGPEFRTMVQHGTAFSAQQVKRMAQGFRM